MRKISRKGDSSTIGMVRGLILALIALVIVLWIYNTQTGKTIKPAAGFTNCMGTDSDGDGVFDNFDKCCQTPKGYRADIDGCSFQQISKDHVPQAWIDDKYYDDKVPKEYIDDRKVACTCSTGKG